MIQELEIQFDKGEVSQLNHSMAAELLPLSILFSGLAVPDCGIGERKDFEE